MAASPSTINETLLSRLARWLIEPSAQISTTAERRRARLLSALTAFAFCMVILSVVAGGAAGSILSLTLLGVAYAFSRTRWYRWGALLAVVSLMIPSFIAVLTISDVGLTDTTSVALPLSWLIIALILASLWANTWITVIATLVTVGLVVGLPLVRAEANQRAIMWMVTLFSVSGGLLTLAAALRNRDLNEIETQTRVLEDQRARLETSSQQYRGLVENVSDIVYTTNGLGHFTYVSVAAQNLTGSPATQLVGTHYSELVDPVWRATVQEFYRTQTQSPDPETTLTFPIITTTGQRRWVEQKVTPLFDNAHKMLGFQGVVRDITERKLAEEKLRSLYEVMAQPTLSIDEQLTRALQQGTRILNLELGIISQIEANTYTIIYAYSPDASLQPGQTFEFRETYCEITYQADGVVSIENIAESPHAGHPCYAVFGLKSYIGIPLRVHGKRYGTLNFSSADVHMQTFTSADMDFFSLMGNWVSTMLERKFAEEQLRASEANLRSLLNNTPAITIKSNREARIELLRVPGINPEQLEPLTGQSFLDFMPEKYHDTARAALRQVFDEKRNAQYETTGIDPADGTEHFYVTSVAPIIEDDRVVSALLVNADITDRKLAEDKVQALLEAIPDMLFQIDTSGVFLDFKASQNLRTVVPPAAFLGKNIRDVLPHLSEQTIQAVRQAVETGIEQLFEYELTEDNELHYFEARITRSGESDALVIVRDITTLKQADAARKESERQIQIQNEALVKANRDLAVSRKQAEAANKLKSQFLATMSHELRTPLNAVIGYAQLQLAGMVGELSDEQFEFQERILANAQHLLSLINEVLDLSKIEAGRMELAEKPFALRDCLEEIIEQNKVLAEDKGLEFTLTLDDRLPELITGDQGRIRQIVVNLVSNAIKFTDDGSVSIDAALQSKDAWRLTVRDTGSGISPTMQETIFDEFRQAENGIERGGTGLGLAIVRKLVLMMGGNIRLSSEVGRGSVFTITLPLVTEAQLMPEIIEA